MASRRFCFGAARRQFGQKISKALIYCSQHSIPLYNTEKLPYSDSRFGRSRSRVRRRFSLRLFNKERHSRIGTSFSANERTILSGGAMISMFRRKSRLKNFCEVPEALF